MVDPSMGMNLDPSAISSRMEEEHDGEEGEDDSIEIEVIDCDY